jgi:hypothetical protein
MLDYTRVKKLNKEKHSCLLGPFVTSNYFQQARVLDYIRPEKHAMEKHSNLLGLFVAYKENKVFSIEPLVCLYFN